ncbi:hypothetical protein CGC21_13110 [Leishmania donovani]|uniref:Uncharacterized protein n=1 Tax=Leishmania donovani TaxID=5661 RepID=A0A504XGR8_LEIDO|nr:hypothetical protein CGC21_13110 [Leishmania donovani]
MDMSAYNGQMTHELQSPGVWFRGGGDSKKLDASRPRNGPMQRGLFRLGHMNAGFWLDRAATSSCNVRARLFCSSSRFWWSGRKTGGGGWLIKTCPRHPRRLRPLDAAKKPRGNHVGASRRAADAAVVCLSGPNSSESKLRGKSLDAEPANEVMVVCEESLKRTLLANNLTPESSFRSPSTPHKRIMDMSAYNGQMTHELQSPGVWFRGGGDSKKLDASRPRNGPMQRGLFRLGHMNAGFWLDRAATSSCNRKSRAEWRPGLASGDLG